MVDEQSELARRPVQLRHRQIRLALRRLLPGALFLFLAPNDMRQLERRLRERGGDEETMRRRLETAQREMAEREHFDHVVENVEGDLDGTADRVLAIVRQERARPGRRAVEV